jgi:hypothetical protein
MGKMVEDALREKKWRSASPAETGTPVKEVIRKMGIVKQTRCCWKKLCGGLCPGEVAAHRILMNQVNA